MMVMIEGRLFEVIEVKPTSRYNEFKWTVKEIDNKSLTFAKWMLSHKYNECVTAMKKTIKSLMDNGNK